MAAVSNAPSPLQPRSPSLQNITSARSPFGTALPLRKPSLREPLVSPRKAIREPPPTSDNPPLAKRRKLEPDYDMAEQLNRSVEAKYTKGKKLGEGTFAVVYKGHLKSDPNQIVAIKKFKISKETAGQGINVDTIREIKYLQIGRAHV